MTDNLEPLWLHEYSGKENGLMVVGTPASLKNLAQQIETAIESQQSPSKGDWPIEIASPLTIGPYTDSADFCLSFHIQGSAALDQILPLKRSAMKTPLFLAAAFCAFVGLVTIIRWLWSFI